MSEWTNEKHNELWRLARVIFETGMTEADANGLRSHIPDALDEIDRLRAENERLTLLNKQIIAQ